MTPRGRRLFGLIGALLGLILLSAPVLEAQSGGDIVLTGSAECGTAPEVLSVYPTSLSFNFKVGDGVATIGLRIAMASGTAGAGRISASTTDGRSWLEANGLTRYTWTAPETVMISVDPAGLTPGIYRGTLLLESTTGAFAPVSVPVTAAVAMPLEIATAALPNAVGGIPYVFQMQASGGTGTGYTWSLESGSLSPGLSLSPSGLISGTPPTVSSTSTMTFGVGLRDSASNFAGRLFSLVLEPAFIILPLSPSSFRFVVGTPYAVNTSVKAEASGGTPPYRWAASAMPPGLTVDASTGWIIGTPTQPGSFNSRLTVTDSTGKTASATVTLVSLLAPLQIADSSGRIPPVIPAGTVGQAYSLILAASGGSQSGYVWSVQGALPPGVTSQNSPGCPAACGLVIGGVPTTSGSYAVTTTVRDSLGTQATASLTILINSGTPPAISTTRLPKATIGASFSAALQATGGSGGYVWSVIGVLPDPGLSLSSAGVVSGVPTLPNDCLTGATNGGGIWTGSGTSKTFTVKATDTSGNSASASLCLVSYYSTPATISITPVVTIDGQNHVVTLNGTNYRTDTTITCSGGVAVPTTYAGSGALTTTLVPSLFGFSWSNGQGNMSASSVPCWVVQPFADFSNQDKTLTVANPRPVVTSVTAVLNNTTSQPCRPNVLCQLMISGSGFVVDTSAQIVEPGLQLGRIIRPATAVPYSSVTTSSFTVGAVGTYTARVANPLQADGTTATVDATFTVSAAAARPVMVEAGPNGTTAAISGVPYAGSTPDHPAGRTGEPRLGSRAVAEVLALSGTSPAVRLTWNNVSGATAFDVYRDDSVLIAGLTNPSYVDRNGLAAGSTHTYFVQANLGGLLRRSNVVSVAIPSAICSLPGAPTGLLASSTSSATTSLAWTDNATNETGFKVERKAGSGGTYAQIGTSGQNLTFYNDGGLTPGSTYCYRVRATNGVGDSAYSNEACATTSAQANAILTVSGIGTGTGTVASSVGGISCGSSCTATLAAGTAVTLTASASSGSVFTGWGGACSGTGVCSIKLNSSTTVAAEFMLDSPCHRVTVAVDPPGTGTAVIATNQSCTGGYREGSVVALQAGAMKGFRFDRWSTTTGTLDGASSETARLTVTGSAVVVAGFVPDASKEPQPSFTWSPTSPEVTDTVQFHDTSAGSPTRWAWDVDGDGNPDSTSRDSTFVFLEPGRKSVTLTVSNAYGSRSLTQFVDVRSPKPVPKVISVKRSLTGFFLDGSPFENRFDVKVDWAGAAPGTVRFSVNGGAPFSEAGGPTGGAHVFRMDRDFPAALTPSVVRIVPVTASGLQGVAWDEKVLVFPFPTWLTYLAKGSHGLASYSLDASGGEVVASFGLEYPKPHIGASFVPPSWVPYVGGSKLGLRETFVGLDARISGTGRGEVSLAGATGFEAMGKAIDGSVSGSGTFRLGPPNGIELVEASGSLHIGGKLTDERGILDVFPQTAAFAKTEPGRWLNDKAKLQATLGLDLTVATALEGGPSGIQFKDTTATLGFNAKAVLRFTPIDRVTAEGWMSGDGHLTIGFREPYLRDAGLGVEAGVRVEVDATFRVLWHEVGGKLSEAARVRATCAWVQGANIDCRTDSGSGAVRNGNVDSSASEFGITTIRKDFARFGPYEAIQQAAVKRPFEAGSVTRTQVLSNVFEGASPKLVPVDQGRLLVWAHQNPSLEPVQATDIAWSYQGADGRWSDVAVVQSDRQAELSPVAARAPDGRVVAAWLRNKEVAFDEPIETLDDLPRFYSKLEVVSSVFDPRTQAWGPVVALTDDDALDTDLKLSSGPDGRLMLTWIKLPGGLFESTASRPASLVWADWTGNAWSTPASVATGLVGVSGHSVALTSSGAVVAVAESSEAGNAAGIWTYRRSGATWAGPELLAAGGQERTPRLAVTGGNRVHATWLDGETLVYQVLGQPSRTVVRAGSGSAAFQDVQLVASPRGSLALLWQQISGNEPAHVFARLMEPGSGRWTEDLRIDEGDNLAYAVSAELGADALRLVYLESEVGRRDEVATVGGASYTFTNLPDIGKTSIVVLERALEVDLEAVAGSLELNPSLPAPEQPLTVSAVVRNRGEFSVAPFSVDVMVGGVTVHRWRLDEGLAAGAAQTLSAVITYPHGGGEVVITVDPDGEIAEVTKANNILGTSFSNAPPVVVLTASATQGSAPLVVDFDATGSLDPEGGPVAIQWLFGDGTGAPTGSRVSHTFGAPGRYVVTASGRDPLGAVGAATVTIEVGTVLEVGQATSEKVIPVVLDLAGQGGARYSSELSLCNAGSTVANVELQYTAADSVGSSGSGSVYETLAPGGQLVVPDAISYLRSRGLAIPDAVDAPQAGTLRAVFRGLEEPASGQAMVRTGAPAGKGRAGLSYAAQRLEDLNGSVVQVFGLRESSFDRSNLALVNAGRSGPITLTIKLVSGDPGRAGQVADTWQEVLGPGQWRQVNRVLNRAGLTNGYVEVTRTAGVERFLAYGVFNDNVTNDGSFVPGIGADALPVGLQVVPAVLETGSYQSELVLANPNPFDVAVQLVYVESMAAPAGFRTAVTETLAAGEQKVIPQFLDYLRSRGVAIGSRGGSYAGALRVLFSSGAGPAPGFAGTRTATAGSSERYGLFYVGIGVDQTASSEAWLFGLQQDGQTRSNIAFVNADDRAPITVEYAVFAGTTGATQAPVGRGTVVLGPGAWAQKNGVLADFGVASGYVRVRRIAGGGRFVTYGVLNDGGSSRAGTNDGSYVLMTRLR